MNSYDEMLLSPAWLAWISLSFFLGIMCLTFNALTIIFYKEKRKDTLPLLYLALSICDFITGIAAVINGGTMLALKMGIKEMILLSTSIALTSLTSHLSVFCNTMVVSVRTLNLIWPYYKPRTGVLKFSFLLYIVLWIAITTIDLVTMNERNALRQFFVPTIGSGVVVWLQVLLAHRPALSYWLSVVLCITIPYILPAVVCLIGCFVQAITLIRRARSRTGALRVVRRLNRMNIRISLTILYLTGVFFVCNTTYLLVFSIMLVRYMKAHVTITLWGIMLCHGTGVQLAFLNSALNPVILIVRGNELKCFIRDLMGPRLSNLDGTVIRNTNVNMAVTRL